MCKQRWSRYHGMLKKYMLHCAWSAAQHTRAIHPPAPAAAAAKPVGPRLAALALALLPLPRGRQILRAREALGDSIHPVRNLEPLFG